ncbi:MAG TPA: hypothetical protein VF868_16135 [Bacteroidia bacterium]|jgi:hypothetical protein
MSKEPLEILKVDNKWDNAYWFARDLINNDKYGGIGKDSKLLSVVASSLRVIARDNSDKNVALELQKQTLRNILTDRFKNAKALSARVQRLLDDLDKAIKNPDDMDVFILVCESIMIPMNQAISNIPSDDKEFTLNISKSYLDIQGEKGLATVISLWDDLGVKGCLTVERTEIVKAFTSLRVLLSKDKLADEDKDIVLTAFTQEFERRAGQKRKGRAGGSLEDVTDFILAYYNIKRAEAPAHFQADIEVDNWVKTKDGWLIGISCKRTLRERWKQVSSAEAGILSKFKIKHIYHIVTYDEDLSDDKLTLLGGHRHIFYLPDNSRRLKIAQAHVGLKDYVRPISELVNDLKKHTK